MKRFEPYDARYASNMLRVAAQANAEPAWADYGVYCSHRANGLRAQAFAALEHLLSRSHDWTFREKREFVVWLFSLSGEGDFIPHPLAESLVKPTLCEWSASSPEDPEPLVLMGSVDSRWRAWQLAPTDPRVCLAFVERAIPHLEMSAHELPVGWVGELAYDRPLLAAVLAALPTCATSDALPGLRERVESVRTALLTYLGESA